MGDVEGDRLDHVSRIPDLEPRDSVDFMRRPLIRAAAGLLLLTAWLALLFAGVALHGGIHLLLLAALGVFPWRSGSRTLAAGAGEPQGASAAEGLDRARQHADP
jgi:hypothetical protein